MCALDAFFLVKVVRSSLQERAKAKMKPLKHIWLAMICYDPRKVPPPDWISEQLVLSTEAPPVHHRCVFQCPTHVQSERLKSSGRALCNLGMTEAKSFSNLVWKTEGGEKRYPQVGLPRLTDSCAVANVKQIASCRVSD